MLGDFKGSGNDVAVTLHTLRKEMEALPQTHRDLRKLLTTAERTAAEFSTTAQAIERAVPELTTKLGSAIESIDGAAQQLRKTGEEAQGTIQKAQPVLERSDAVARDAGEVFNAAKRVWPLSDSFNEIIDRELPIDSFDAPQGAQELRALPLVRCSCSPRCGGTKAARRPAQSSSQSQSRLADAESAPPC